MSDKPINEYRFKDQNKIETDFLGGL